MSDSAAWEELGDHHRYALQRLTGDMAAEAAAQAVVTLQRETESHPEDARPWSDLSAARMVWGQRTDEPLRLIEALEAAETAVSLAPTSADALFNRALASHRLLLSADAEQAWLDFLALETGDRWEKEAGEHLSRIRDAPDAAEIWRATQHWLQEVADDRSAPSTALDLETWRDEAAERLQPFRRDARQWVQNEILPAWADAELEDSPTEATRLLTLADRVARLLALDGDPLLAEAVAVIHGAAAPHTGDATALAHLVLGHQAFGQIQRLLTENDLMAALEKAEIARDQFIAADTPFRHWADLGRARIHLALQETPRSFRILEALGARSVDYPALEGHRSWLRAHAQYSSGQLIESRESYRLAVKSFRRAREQGSLADVEIRLAEIFDQFGDSEEAWRYRFRALRRQPSLASLASHHYLLGSVALSLGQRDLHRASLRLQDAAVDLIRRRSGDPHRLAVQLFHHAAAHLDRNQPEEARQSLEEAFLQASRVADPQGLYLRAQVRAVEARLLARSGSRQGAIRAYGDALQWLSEDQQHDLRTVLHSERATLFRQAGQLREAARELEAALDQIDRSWRKLLTPRQPGEDESLWPYLLGRPQETFDRLVDLQLELGRAEEAFAVSERGRARDLLDLLRRLPPASSPAISDDRLRTFTLAEVQRALPPGVLLVEFAQLPERLVIWAIRRDDSQYLTVPASATDLRRLVSRLARSADQKRRQLEPDLRRELAEALLRPILPTVRPGDHLVFVPDESLHSVPFAALPLPGSERLLVDEYSSAIAPSAATYVRVLERDQQLRASRSTPTTRRPDRAFFVGDPAFEVRQHPGFERLPHAQLEAQQAAEIWPNSTLRTGKEATPEEFLRQLPHHSIVHYAGHAILNQNQPFKSFLLLASDSAGDESALYAEELLRRSLPGTRLVVLSACSTARGKSLAELGVAPLVRPFLGGGVPAVVASLWDVDDQATERLLVEFHHHLRAGLGAAEALRQAQLALLHGDDPNLTGPLNWASFQLVGHLSKDSEPTPLTEP